ncbi:MAG: Cof-type HAD-IIB family hydrolase [Ruminococcaceae bacterium]|nr:Cof-type HAD-IIB family hydrolase [Oscillospiraceae bacterium]
MRDIRLIGLDLDGTALNSQKEMTPAVQAAIARAIAAGVAVLPATGRALGGIPQAFLGIPGVRYALASNGAMVYDVIENKTLLADCFTKETALALLAQCEGYSLLSIAAFVNGEAYAEKVDADGLRQHYSAEMVAHLVLTRQKVPSLRALIETSPHPVEKFSLVVDDKARRKLAMQALAERGDCTVTSSMPYNLELNTATANKGRALLQLGSLLGLQAAQVMAMGDSLNDLDMLNMAGYAVAMADARPEVLAAADAVTTTSDEDGVARAINAVLDGQPL